MFMCGSGMGHTTKPGQKAIIIPHAIRVKIYKTRRHDREGFETIAETPYCEEHAGAAEYNYRGMVKMVMEEVKEAR